MSLPNQGHPDNEQHWTQITDQALRKRVQNRMSQRKHRNKVRQQFDNATATEPLDHLADDMIVGNGFPSQTLTSSDNASVHLQPPASQDVNFGDLQAPPVGPLDSWSAVDAFDNMDLGATDFVRSSTLASSPTSSWSVSGQSTAQTPSMISDTSLSPISPNPGFPPLAGPSSALPGPQWRVVGVQEVGSPNQGRNVQAAAAGHPRSTVMSAPTSTTNMPVMPQTYNPPAPYHQQATNVLSSQNMSYNTQIFHNRGGGSTSGCGQCGCHGSHHHSRPSPPLEHGAVTPVTVTNSTAPDPACSGSAFDLSRYGIDINHLLDSPNSQIPNNNNNNGPRVIYIDEHHRELVNHHLHCNQNCGHNAPRIPQEATQFILQQSPHQGSNLGNGQGRVVVVYVQNTNYGA
ncbi:MAG: hypothetical protein Q9166_000674 [cf. Caloplaca sp. 2 TL-2023]